MTNTVNNPAIFKYCTNPNLGAEDILSDLSDIVISILRQFSVNSGYWRTIVDQNRGVMLYAI